MATGTVMSSRQPGATSCSSGRSRPSVRARASVRLLPFRRSCARAHSGSSVSFSLLFLFLFLVLVFRGRNPAILRVFSCPVPSGLARRVSDPARVRSGLPRGAWDPARVRPALACRGRGPGARSVGIGVSGRGDPARVPSARVPSGLARGMWAPARVRSGLTRGPLNSAPVPLTPSRREFVPRWRCRRASTDIRRTSYPRHPPTGGAVERASGASGRCLTPRQIGG